jgi:hypothetical protein
MNAEANIATTPSSNASNASRNALIRTGLMSLWIVFLVLRVGLKHGNHLSPIYLWLLVFPAALLLLLLLSSKKASRWTLGNVQRIQISSPEFEQKMRNRYETEISQLSSLGFDCAFFYGESFSIFRFLLIFPAIVALSMRSNGVTMTLQGTSLLNGNPVLVSRDKRAFAHPNGMGLSFHTAFRDGSLLVSKNYGDGDSSNASQVTIKRYDGASIGECWAQHQRSVSLFETDANPVDRQSTFDAYCDDIRKEEKLY